jgi:hypothetical protein
MSTEDIKEELSSRYPSEKFSRRSKVKDNIGYTHRGFESATRKIVVTSDEDDSEITDVVEIATLPDSTSLKDGARSWIPNGPLSNYYYSFQSGDGMNYLVLSDKYTFDTHGYLSDSHGKDSFIESLFRLYILNSSVVNIMESVYEVEEGEIPVLKSLLPKLGATENSAL